MDWSTTPYPAIFHATVRRTWNAVINEPTHLKRTRKRPRFTLGVMMLLVMAVGGWLGWLTHRARVQREAVAAIVHAGGEVFYDHDWMNPAAKPPGPVWLRELIGRDYFDTVCGVGGDNPAVDDAVVAQIGRLTQIRFIGLQGSTVTDSGLAGLAGLHDLRTIHFHAPNVNGSGFRQLSGLRRLTNLHFYETPIGDENLVYLVPLTGIENLSLTNTRVSDVGMTHVAMMTGLKKLKLASSDVGDDGLRELGRIRRPIRVSVSPKTRITSEAIEMMRSLNPEMTITP